MSWFISILIPAFIISELLARRQQKIINSYTYYEVLDNGMKIPKIQCPKCGNKAVDFQLVNSSAGSFQTSKRTSSAVINNAKHAICPNCSCSFQVAYKVNRFGTFIAGIFLSLILSLVLNLILLLI